jgi:phosphoglucosamine mutase
MGRFFGTDGIRGTVGEWPLTPEFFLKLGLSFAAVMLKDEKPYTVVIGRDTRRSGEMLQSALEAGLLAGGVNVIDVSVIPTSGVAWLVKRLGYEAGAVISASHNPVEQNGIKFIDANGFKLPEKLENDIEQLLLKDDFDSPISGKRKMGKLTSGLPHHEVYNQGLLKEHDPSFLHGLTLLVDCSNGAASQFAPEIFNRAGAQVIAIHSSPNGENINLKCGSEFARRNPGEVGKLIRHFQADFGLAFDGDADRVVFVDEQGNLIDGDHILGFLAHYLEQKGQLLANTIVTTQMRNTGLKNYLEGVGLQVFETPVGDKYVVEKLFELRRQSPDEGKFGLGGEQAGHIDIVNDEFTTGDGIRTALYVMRAYLESRENSMTSFAASVGKTPQIIASAYVGAGPRFDKQTLVEMEDQLQHTYPGLSRVNLRYSGTEPLFRVMLEAGDQLSVVDLARIAWNTSREAQRNALLKEGTIDILNCTTGGVIAPLAGWQS